MTSLRFVTWNTNGIKNPPEKFSKVINSLNDLQADIAFIQETRIGPTDDYNEIFTAANHWKVYFTVHHPTSKGVAVMIKNNVPFEYICHDEDCSGGYIVLFCYLYGELYTLVNVYKHKADKFVLGRLKEYLMETAEGVLVVGGDFNKVLHPCFDRRPPASKHSQLKTILEDFTVSLNLRDIWSYLHFDDDGFTRQQNESHSRIDMFFTHSDMVGRASNITVEHNDVSDHNPVVLEFKVQMQTEEIIPKVALRQITQCDEQANRISGKISGAEILSAIKTLANSTEQRPDQRQVSYYKEHRCPITESLKIMYNNMLKTNRVSEAFKDARPSGDRHTFNVEYLIFSQILAKRLSEYIFPYVKENLETNLVKFLTVTFKKDIQKCKLSFFKMRPSIIPFIMNTTYPHPFGSQGSLSESQLTSGETDIIQKFEAQLKKLRNFAPPEKFRILKELLPKVPGSSGDLRLLLPGCPLKNAMLNLTLNKLDWILNSEKECMSSVCFQRQALCIHAHKSKQEQVVEIVERFQELSGLKFEIRYHIDSDE